MIAKVLPGPRPMCSRYSLTSPPEAVRAYFGYRDTPNFPARYNIAPTQAVAVVCLDEEGKRRFRLMRWGLLPSFVKDPKQFPTLINARAGGGAGPSPSFRAGLCASGAAWSRPTASTNGPGPRASAAPFCFARGSAA